MSYTSISESTSTTVLDTAFSALVKPQKMLKDTYIRLGLTVERSVYVSDIFCFNFFRTEYSENDSAMPVIEAITKAPSRCMHLPLQQVLELLFYYTLGNIVINSNVLPKVKKNINKNSIMNTR